MNIWKTQSFLIFVNWIKSKCCKVHFQLTQFINSNNFENGQNIVTNLWKSQYFSRVFVRFCCCEKRERQKNDQREVFCNCIETISFIFSFFFWMTECCCWKKQKTTKTNLTLSTFQSFCSISFLSFSTQLFPFFSHFPLFPFFYFYFYLFPC